MYARLSWFESLGDQLEARMADFPRRMQGIRQAPGCIGIGALVNRESGAALSVTYWDSKDSMLATESAGEQIRSQVIAEGPQLRNLDRFEVVLQERTAPPRSSTFVRTNDFVAPTAKIDAVADVLRAHISDARNAPGFLALLVFANRETGRMLVGSIWDSAAHREASREAARSVGEEMRAVRGETSVTTELYEVAYTDIKLPAPA